IQQYLSGDPLAIYSSLGANFTPGIRPDIVSGVKQTESPGRLNVNLVYSCDDNGANCVTNGAGWLNPAAFVDPPASASGYPLRIGTAPRLLPNVRGPGHLGEDFGIIKNTRISERVTFQIRADMFNVFN